MNYKNKLKTMVGCGLILLALDGLAAETATPGEAKAREVRAEALRGVRATYCRAPRLENGRANVRLLVQQLVEIHANTYSFCIHSGPNDWEDLQLLLPVARKHGIRMWGSVVPPSESPPTSKKYAEPFRLDYERWAVEFAKLSLRETNLVAWSIDDFSHNVKTTYTTNELRRMLEAARAINPRLAFVPCCYYKEITPKFVKDYEPLLDGILFPYRHESGGANLKDADLTEPEVRKIKAMTGPDFAARTISL
jgi:hypothetical protein